MAGVPVPVDDDDGELRAVRGSARQENEGHNPNPRKTKFPYKISSDLESAFVHPLLIDHIAENVFSHTYEIMDLSTCFNVCRLWRKLVTPFHIKRADPVKLSGDLTDDESKRFLSDLVKYPELKMEKFHFLCVNFNSPITKSMLQQIGENIRSLNLDYKRYDIFSVNSNESSSVEENASPAAAAVPVSNELMTSTDLKELLLNLLPNLEILEIESMPFIDLAQNMNYATSGKELKLKEIKFGFDVFLFGKYFLRDLYSVCPHLESIKLPDLRSYFTVICEILLPLKNLSRIQQLKKLKFPGLYSGSGATVLDFLNSELAVGQLEDFKAIFLSSIDSNMLEEFLNKQGPSLKSLELTFSSIEETELKVNPMPNLTRLKICTPTIDYFYLERIKVKVDFGFHAIREFKFPKLETLELGGNTRMLIMDSLFPQCDEADIQPVNSLRVISGLPIGVDQPLMKRIGQLFPNLTVLMTVVPLEFQDMLISVWEYCTNLEELVLNLDEMEKPQNVDRKKQLNKNANECEHKLHMNPPVEDLTEEKKALDLQEEKYCSRSLDSIFSGIPETQCQHLKQLTEEELENVNWSLYKTEPSINNLKSLRKLFIYGPGKRMFTISGRRDDKFSNLFGYSTLAFLSPRTITFAYILGHLTDVSPRCVEFIGRQLNLTQHQSTLGSSVYLIKTGCGFENEDEAEPFNWTTL